MKDIKANNQAALFSILRAIDIRVPTRKQGRTTEHCERWSICRLFATLAKNDLIEYPVELVKYPAAELRGIKIQNLIAPVADT